MTLFESFVNVAFVLFVNRYPVQDTKKGNEIGCKPKWKGGDGNEGLEN